MAWWSWGDVLGEAFDAFVETGVIDAAALDGVDAVDDGGMVAAEGVADVFEGERRGGAEEVHDELAGGGDGLAAGARGDLGGADVV
ncbi:MAG: hypothetical protein QNL12_02165, partial [Acidimicrobiia bacterium]|nr:hypothetical protein [Acidimicrobiia bacterium]